MCTLAHMTIKTLFTTSVSFLSVLALTAASPVWAQKSTVSNPAKQSKTISGYPTYTGKVKYNPAKNGFNGWHNYGKQGVNPQWVVEGDAFHLTAKGGGDLVTDAVFGDFELTLEWKISEAGNSGIFYLVNEDTAKYKAIYMTAPEYQVLDNDKHPDGKYENHRAGANYDLIVPEPGHTKPVGEWNKTRIVLKDSVVEHWLNDHKVVSYKLWTEEWRAMVAKSKFKNWAGYGMSPVGRIGLQDHADKVWYRNIVIKGLDKKKAKALRRAMKARK